MISSIYLLYQVLALSRTSQAMSTGPIEPLLSAAGDNRTTLKTQISPAWVSNSGVRGTSDILWSCVVTLTACVYTAIHLNVPPPQEGSWQFLWRKSKWVALALFAPEIVLYCALTQLSQAWKFKNEMNELWATRQAALDHPDRKESKLAPPDAPGSHSDDNSNADQQNDLAHVTQQNQAPSEISPLPLPKTSAPESEDTIKDEDGHPISGGNDGDEISFQQPQRSLSISSKRNADGQSGPKGFDLEKGMVTSYPQRFSLKFGLFVVMGGIVTHDVAKISDCMNAVVLGPAAVIQFARRGVFPDIPGGTISDKSKANLLGKGLVCIQVMWFLIQCVARAAAGYPLALLEVHTMVHVVCALLMYALWWEKPQDVSEPVVQDVSGDMDLLAMLSVMSYLPKYSLYKYEARDLIWYGETALQDPLLNRSYNESRFPSLEPSDPRYEVKVLREVPESQILESFDRPKDPVVALAPGQALSCGVGPLTFVTYLSPKDVLRWSKLAEWLDKFEHRNPRCKVAVSQSEDLDSESSLRNKLRNQSDKIVLQPALFVHVSDLPVNLSLRLYSYLLVHGVFLVPGLKVPLILFVALPLIYGGIHLTTWNFDFASQTERLLWKIACIDIMGTIPLSVAFFGGTGLLSIKIFTRTGRYISWILFTSLFIFYAFSRIYIVVESFISLRHVPLGVYAAIPWVQDIPHI